MTASQLFRGIAMIFYRATLSLCWSVCLPVCHKSEFCQSG